MNFSAEGISAIIVAMAGFVSGMYNLMQARRMQTVGELEKAKKELEQSRNEQHDAEKLLEVAMYHIHVQNLQMAREGIEPSKLPKALE